MPDRPEPVAVTAQPGADPGRGALGAVAEAITSIGNAATSLGGALNVLEVNPLWVSGDQVEALDVPVVTGEQIR
jgi:hypothetical protein